MLVKPFACYRPALLWTIAQCEKSFLAAQRRALTRYPKNFIGFQKRRLDSSRNCREGAVVATITAQSRQRNENLARVSNDARPPRSSKSLIANARSDLEQAIQLSTSAMQQGSDLIPIKRDPTLGPAEGAIYLPLIN
jgi:hypothetical protein